MSQQISTLIKKRGYIKSKLTRFEKYLESVKEQINHLPENEKLDSSVIIELELRLSRQETLLDEFNECQSALELLDDGEEHKIESELFETLFFKLNAYSKQIINNHTLIHEQGMMSPTRSLSLSNQSLNNSGKNCTYAKLQSNEVVMSGVKLPQIELPKFSGDYASWLEFRDTFTSLIHNNPNIPEISKFHYLRTQLQDSAKQVILSLEVSKQNYNTAWNLICERYDNHRLLIYNHIKALVDAPRLNNVTSSDLRTLADTISKHLRALKSLEQPVESWDTLLIFLLSRKFDKETERDWERSKNAKTLPTINDFMTFIQNRADFNETLEFNRGNINQQLSKGFPHKFNQTPNNIHTRRRFNQSNNINTHSNVFISTNISCLFCKKIHYINQCPDFLKLPIQQKIEQITKLKLCKNCLRNNHLLKDCKSSNCRKCNLRHHTILHNESTQNSLENTHQTQDTQPTSSNQNNPSNYNHSTNLVSMSSQNVNRQNDQYYDILLSTAVIQVRNLSGEYFLCRALLDSASQSNLITAELCNKLNLKPSPVNLSIMGIGQAVSNIKERCNVNIQSCHERFQTNISCLVVPKIIEQIPIKPVHGILPNIPNHLVLADPKFYYPDSIDILLGASIFYSLLSPGQISLGQNQPILQQTVLGWVISGPILSSYVPTESYCNLNTNIDIQDQLQKFWEIEDSSLKASKLLSADEKKCEEIFTQTVTRTTEGRFVVTIPLKEPISRLGDSKQAALTRFQSMESKFKRNPKFCEMYCKFMSEYEDLGHMSQTEISSNNQISYFLPHHGVLNENSETTKLRVVFDGSCQSSTGWSFNDLQLVGPTIQNDLFSIILRFRIHEVVISADIEKMYRQVLIQPDQRNLQQIVWRASPLEEIKTYTMNTVTYGTSSAPYLSIRCLFELANEHSISHPIASTVIKRDFYVDDLLSGVKTPQEAIKLGSQISNILAKGCFKLHKWQSNNDSVLSAFQANIPKESSSIQLGNKQQSKTLGLYWSSKSDILKYNISEVLKSDVVTKRTMLSDIAHIFDPLGMLSPCIISAKILLQSLWGYKLSWDDEIPTELLIKWRTFRTRLSTINHLEIPRLVTCINPIKIQIHGFSDASQVAYGACIYIRSINPEGKIYSSLLCSKSKVVPIKLVTIPRLELCAALILSQLLEKVKNSMQVDYDIYLWSDSTVVLNWIAMSPHMLQTFVANRVTQIQTLTKLDSWGHVGTRDNPADLISRGVDPQILCTSEIWWHGPSWLRESQTRWPNSSPNFSGNIPELKKQTICAVTHHSELFPFNRFSNFNRIQRTVAYCCRFFHNCKSPTIRKSGSLSKSELDLSIQILVKISQKECFSNDIKRLLSNNTVYHKSNLSRLNPFIDESGVIRVGGRLQLSNFDYNKKHPILLSSKHILTKLLFSYEHIRLLHAGPQLLLSIIRETYWPIRGNQLAKQTVYKCIKCFRANPKQPKPIMGLLPNPRIHPKPAFTNVGVDYAGPIMIKDKKGRGSKPIKSYICLFICFSTRAIHLELVSDLTTESFIATLHRFISRRGKPLTLNSDNGKNLVGAASELSRFLKMQNEHLTESLANEGINWKFIPAHSPHFGGYWEAGIKSTKHHLKRILGISLLTFEEMYTALTQIEAVLNSRPLTPMSSDPNDFDTLTPAHFLIGQRLTTIPYPNLENIHENRLTKFQRVQQLQQHFWTRWSREYISELQQRVKWKETKTTLKEGDMVIIKDDHLPPLCWQLGRISKLFPGPDTISRVALIKTKSGIIKRCFSKICTLPIENCKPC